MAPTHVEKRSQAREALLDAAEKLFTEKGFAAVGTRELAEAAGVNLAGIQYYFGSKASLFSETIRRLMERSPGAKFFDVLSLPLADRQDAIDRLALVIHFFLDHLVHPVGPQPCRMMFREIFSETCQDAEMFEALVSSVVDDFIRPVDNLMVSVIGRIKEQASDRERWLMAQSIIGQCSFYVTHRPFAERLRNADFGCSPLFEETSRHISSFTLRALGCSEIEIAHAIAALEANVPLATPALSPVKSLPVRKKAAGKSL